MLYNLISKCFPCISNSQNETLMNENKIETSDGNIINKLKSCEIPKLFTMNGQEKWCRVISVYDGDTINIVFYIDDLLMHYKFRLYGIDSPELKPLKIIENRTDIIDSANRSKKFLESLILNKIVYIKFKNEEKYGRLMGIIYFSKNENEKSVNQIMIDNGYAIEYFGGKKN